MDANIVGTDTRLSSVQLQGANKEEREAEAMFHLNDQCLVMQINL